MDKEERKINKVINCFKQNRILKNPKQKKNELSKE